MCWSGEASAVLAAVGIGTTIYAAYKKQPTFLWVSLGYFSLMELLQAYTYSVIDSCALPSNQIATLFGYLHIAFQPFFINFVALYFVPQHVKERIFSLTMIVCFFAAIIMILQIFPFEWAGKCLAGTVLCGDELCSVHGTWHIAWNLPLNGMFNEMNKNITLAGYHIVAFPSYLVAGVITPLLYGSWRFSLYQIAMGPLLALLLTKNPNEWPAVWCLLSIGLLIIVVKTRVRNYMFVTRYPFWSTKAASV
jgi:Family of unknown function (DUF5765)